MRRNKLFSRVFALLLAASMLISGQPWTAAAAQIKRDYEDGRLYMSDIKMFYGQTEKDAKKACEDEGYIFCPTNMNEGSPSQSDKFGPMGIYMGYKTTEDPDEAITDITLLDMRYTHFDTMTYEDYLDSHLSEYKDLATQMTMLVKEFLRKYEAGSPNAMMAFDSLNLIYVDENKSHSAEDNLLGNYLTAKNDVTFFEKLLQRCNVSVLSKIIDLLCQGIADYEEDGATWVDRAKVSEFPEAYEKADSALRNKYDETFQDAAKLLIADIQKFASTYHEAKALYDEYGETFGYKELEGMTEENAQEKLQEAGTDCRYPEYCEAMKNYALLESFLYTTRGETVVSNGDLLESPEGEETAESQPETYQTDVTLAQYFLELAADKTLEEHPSKVYSIIKAFTVGQRTALALGGLSAIIGGLFQSKEYPSKRKEAVKEAQQKLKEAGCEDGRMYLWMGVDRSLEGKKVTETDVVQEALRSGTDLQESVNDAKRKEQEEENQVLMAIDIATLGYGGAMMIASAVMGASLWAYGTAFCGLGMAAITFGSTVLGAAMVALGAVLCVMWVLNVIAIVVGLVMLVYSILKWTGCFESREKISYDDIPDVIFDVRESAEGKYKVRYDSVTSNADIDSFSLRDENDDKVYINGVPLSAYNLENLSRDHAEMNAYQSVYDRWITVFYSKSPAAGKPIEVTPGEEPFVTKGDYQSPDGYRPLALITASTAVNVNDVEVYGKHGLPLYVFFPGESLGRADGVIFDDGETYITDVRLSHAGNQADAINYLKNNDFTYYDTNLTPYDGYTYLGYKIGSEANALTDLRVANTYTDPKTPMLFGDASYGKAGDATYGTTPDGLSLYKTTAKSAGSPIVGLTIETQRLPLGSGMEPVCLFSGGNAVDFSHKWKDNILQVDDEDWADDVKGYFTATIGGYNYVSRSKDYARYYLDEEDPVNGYYLYFQPKEQYFSEVDGAPQQQYVSGFSYFLAGDNQTVFDKFGSNYEYMQTFAVNNGFELLEKNGEPLRVMSDSAGEMTLGTVWYDKGGGKFNTYTYEQFHTVSDGRIMATNNGGYSMYLESSRVMYELWDNVSRSENDHMIYHTAMYFGVSYTYNPRRAITGIAGLITPYTETTHQIKYTGFRTPAGALQPCNVSIMGCPLSQAGISASYYNMYTMTFPLYTNYEAKQITRLPWMGYTEKMQDGETVRVYNETEVLSHYLLTAGPKEGMYPLKKEDVVFNTTENPGETNGYVPVCDMRMPGQYDYPMNFALETTNKGSEYLYIYLAVNAGGRETEPSNNDIRRIEAEKEKEEEASGETTVEEAASEDGTDPMAVTENEADNTEGAVVNYSNRYTPKKNVAAVFCGVGKTPEEAIVNLYSRAAEKWAGLAIQHSDISYNPSLTEFDEIIPVDLSSGHPWYNLKVNNTSGSISLDDGAWIRGNEFAYYRWDGHSEAASDKSIDDYESDMKCAYIGVVRTNDTKNVAYSLLKFYSDDDTASSTLTTGASKFYLAGGPVRSSEGQYYLYYCPNDGTSPNAAIITDIHISNEMFINGYNTAFSAKESDRAGGVLPAYSQMRMRTDEQNYIHVGYSRKDLPYIESLYIGVGNSKKEAFIDMVGSTNAWAATDVDCNYNSFSDKWIAIGYRRTNQKAAAIRDVFLYSGYNPPETVSITDGTYMLKSKKYVAYAEDVKDKATGKKTSVPGVPYKLLVHNLQGGGSDVVSLNVGNNGPGLYLYYTNKDFYYDKAKETQVKPITNLAFTYGDISLKEATADDLENVYRKSYFRTAEFDLEAYQNPIWECVLGVKGNPQNYNASGTGAARFSMNEGVLPTSAKWHTGDHRVYMYVDRSLSTGDSGYQVRENGKLPEFGYYSPISAFGVLKQVN